MRRTIETAPRDGQAIILEDDAKGTYDVAHWSPEAGEWIGKKGEPSKITPSHWHPLQGDIYLRSVALAAPVTVAAVEAQTAPVEAKRTPHARRGFAAFTATLIGAAFIGLNFRAEVSAYVTRYVGHQEIFRISGIGRQVVERDTQLPSQESRKTDLLALQQQAEADQARAQAEAQEAAQGKQAAEASAPEARQSLQQERDRAEALASELAMARPDVETQVALFGQTTGTVDPSPAPAESSVKDDAPPGGCMPIGLTASGEIVFPIQCREFIERHRGQAVEQKPAAVEERPAVSLPAWANSDTFVKPAQTAKQPDVAPENSKPAIKPVETVPLPRERAMSADNSYCSQRYRSYDPASGTYTDYDGRRHSCRTPDDGDCSQRYRTYDPASGTYTGHDGRRHSCR
jgi:hypothetical protein